MTTFVAFRNILKQCRSSFPFKSKTRILAFSWISGCAFTIGSIKLYNRSKKNQQSIKHPMKNQQSSSNFFNKPQTNNVDSSYTSLWNNLSITQKSLAIGTGVVAGIAAVVA
eukprot:485601_1